MTETNLIRIDETLPIPDIPDDWDCAHSIEKTKKLLANGGREAFRRLAQCEKLSKGTQVYFIQVGKDGPIKIGEAVNSNKRLEALQTGNPIQLYLLGKISNVAQQTEKEIQERFKAFHLRDEWYSPEIKDEVMVLIVKKKTEAIIRDYEERTCNH